LGGIKSLNGSGRIASLYLADTSGFDSDGHTVLAGHAIRSHIDLLDAFAVLSHVSRVPIDRQCGLVKRSLAGRDDNLGAPLVAVEIERDLGVVAIFRSLRALGLL